MKNRIEGLDILRFAAAFSVLLYHYFFIGPLQGSWPKGQFLPITHFGDFGVDVFFIISGFVISMSAEGRTFQHFAKSRFLRIAPALFICSLITASTSSFLPGVSVKEVFTRWIFSQTLFPQAFGSSLLSGVYWTLQIEVKFYIIVALLLLFKLWTNYKYTILPFWLIVSMANIFFIHNKILSDYLLTEYAGHFVAGILLYQLRRKEQNTFTVLGFVLSSTLMWKHFQGFESWISGEFHFGFTEIGTFLLVPVTISIVYWVSGYETVRLPSRIVSTLGAMSYTLYLIHADLGFFERAMSDRWLFFRYPEAKLILKDPVIVGMAIISSLTLAAIVALIFEPPLKRLLKQILFRSLRSNQEIEKISA